MKRRKIGEYLKILILIQIFSFGILAILATGGSDGPDEGNKAGVLSLTMPTFSVSESANASVTITVARTGGKDGAASVDYFTTEGSAKAPGDYQTTQGTLNWADQDAAEKSFDIPITNDAIPENQETFSVTLDNIVGASFGAIKSASINIDDDDIIGANGTLQFSNASYSVSEGSATVTLTLTRTLGSVGDISVDYATVSDTATSPEDFLATSGTLNWTNGDSAAKSFDVQIIDDAIPEVTESFNVNLSNVLGGAVIGSISSASVSINDNEQISGTVSTPQGPLAGVSINLYQIDASGNVGAAIDSATTDSSGNYVLTQVPLDAPAVKYIVRSEGAFNLDSRVTRMQVDINATSDASSDLVTLVAANLNDLTLQEVKEIQTDVENQMPFVVTSDNPTATSLSDRLQAKLLNRQGQFRVLNSKVSHGSICGLLTTQAGTPLADVEVIVRKYSDWNLIAKTISDSAGNYCVNVPVLGDPDPDGGVFDGEYIIGVFNHLDLSGDSYRSSSGWRQAGAPGPRLQADKVSVTSQTPVVNYINIQAPSGATLSGTVSASASGSAIAGVQVRFRDYENGIPVDSAISATDGSYRINLLPGAYLVEAINSTQSAQASEFYDGSSGTHISNLAAPVTLVAGTTTTIDFALESGAELSGTITDGATTNPVIGIRVRIDDSGLGNYGSVFSDRLGYYHIWLKPSSYNVYAYGQYSPSVNLGTAGSTVAVDFSDSVSKFQGLLQDTANNPVRHAKLRLYDSTPTFMGFEYGDNNGVYTLYSNLIDSHFLEIRMDRTDSTVGSIIYKAALQLTAGDPIVTASAGDNKDLGTTTLSAGGMLSGVVYADAAKTSTIPNFRLQVRHGGLDATFRFLTIRTRGDGSYSVSLPGAVYDRVKFPDASGNGNCDGITIVAGTTTVLNFVDATNVCEVNP